MTNLQMQEVLAKMDKGVREEICLVLNVLSEGIESRKKALKSGMHISDMHRYSLEMDIKRLTNIRDNYLEKEVR